jgi:hypothetical protein
VDEDIAKATTPATNAILRTLSGEMLNEGVSHG